MTHEIWIADDDANIRFVLAAALRDADYRVRAFESVAAVLEAFGEARPRPDLVLTDVRMPGEDGLALLRKLRENTDGLPVIVMSAYTDVATTAAAWRAGAVDYISKPFDLDQVVATVRRALADAAKLAPAAPDPALARTALLGQSAAMREVFRLVGRVATSDLDVLVTGETGTGKELVARALHAESRHRDGPFVALNTAAIPAELLESELFGHEAGAFTGARQRHVGRFEQAEGGTLFLDEIGDMPLALQTRLLRVLAEGEFYRVGGRELIRCHVRIIAATHRDLDTLVAAGGFRADLRHRLDVVRIVLPPLRRRREDIALLARHFLATAARDLALPPKRFSRAAMAALEQYDFPGNVRELENLCRRVTVVAPGAEVSAADLGLSGEVPASGADESGWTGPLRAWAERALAEGETGLYARAQDDLERALLPAALAFFDGHRQRAAKALGLGRNTLARKLNAIGRDDAPPASPDEADG